MDVEAVPLWIEYFAEFEGLIAVLLGAGVGFFATYLTNRQNHRQELQKASVERAQTGAASIMQMSMALAQKQPHDIHQQELDALVTELMVFYVHQAKQHPAAAKWAKSRAGVLMARRRYPLGTAAAREYALKMSIDLAEWLGGDSSAKRLNSSTAQADWDQIIDRYEEAKAKVPGFIRSSDGKPLEDQDHQDQD